MVHSRCLERENSSYSTSGTRRVIANQIIYCFTLCILSSVTGWSENISSRLSPMVLCWLKKSNSYTMYQVSLTKFKTHKAEPVEQTDSSEITILFSTWNNKIRGMHRENKLYINQSQILFKVRLPRKIFFNEPCQSM